MRLRTPTSTPGRRYSYHRAFLLAYLATFLFLMRRAVAGEATERVDRKVAGAVVLVALAGLGISPALKLIRRLRSPSPQSSN